ncbi:MAG: ABC transporter substrate-binding protein [Rhizomicrobium sp.]|nr:ABC transporter substrate-binding protein [Rhizomicrobium sp.]
MMVKHKSFILSFAVVAALVLSLGLSARSAAAAVPAEQYITDNIQKGLTILNNAQLSKEQRKTEFQGFLLGITDINVIARYTLGQYRRSASPEDLTAFDAAFKDYAMAVYQSYFTKYSGQTLKVTGSYALTADETVVKAATVDPKKPGAKPFEVNFRVQNTGSRQVVVDFSVEGVWIRELERNDFTSYLGQHNGDVKALIAMLKAKAAQSK